MNRCLTRAGCDHHMKTGATVAAFARPVRLRPVDLRLTPCPRASPIAPRTSSLAVRTQRRKLRRTRPERSAWPEPEPTSSGPWQPREPMLPDDRVFGPATARLTQRQRIFVNGLFRGSSRLRRRVEPATAIGGTLTQLYRSNPVVASVNCFIPQPMRTNPPRQTLYHDHCSWLFAEIP